MITVNFYAVDRARRKMLIDRAIRRNEAKGGREERIAELKEMQRSPGTFSKTFKNEQELFQHLVKGKEMWYNGGNVAMDIHQTDFDGRLLWNKVLAFQKNQYLKEHPEDWRNNL